jgi:hypothetical protein
MDLHTGSHDEIPALDLENKDRVRIPLSIKVNVRRGYVQTAATVIKAVIKGLASDISASRYGCPASPSLGIAIG